MTFAKGSKFYLQIEDTPGSDTWTTVGCQRSTSITHAREQIDVTGKCNMPNRTLINGGVYSVDISASGIYDNSAGQRAFEAIVQSGDIVNYKVVDEDTGDELEGPFQVSSYEKTGEYNAEVQFSSTLLSAGAITFTASTP